MTATAIVDVSSCDPKSLRRRLYLDTAAVFAAMQAVQAPIALKYRSAEALAPCLARAAGLPYTVDVRSPGQSAGRASAGRNGFLVSHARSKRSARLLLPVWFALVV